METRKSCTACPEEDEAEGGPIPGGGIAPEAPNPLDALVGVGASTCALKALVSRVADTDLTLLITGETGVGKGVVAKAAHQLSRRRTLPFVHVNCAAIPAPLVESELFGYEAGAFSGASPKGKPGKFELAGRGTILLDEMGDLPREVQPKLLRVLQEQEFERVGGTHAIPMRARVICSTNADLARLMEQGRFRRDLYYRINGMEIPIRPLRDRREDIPALCGFLIEKINLRYGTAITGVEEALLALLAAYDWPGNVRELEHALERACILSETGVLSPAYFTSIPQLPRDTPRAWTVGGCDLPGQRRRLESQAITEALHAAGGNKSNAARRLGISRQALYKKMAFYHIDG